MQNTLIETEVVMQRGDRRLENDINLLKPTGYVMHQQVEVGFTLFIGREGP